jgi:hypothetical protein
MSNKLETKIDELLNGNYLLDSSNRKAIERLCLQEQIDLLNKVFLSLPLRFQQILIERNKLQEQLIQLK